MTNVFIFTHMHVYRFLALQARWPEVDYFAQTVETPVSVYVAYTNIFIYISLYNNITYIWLTFSFIYTCIHFIYRFFSVHHRVLACYRYADDLDPLRAILLPGCTLTLSPAGAKYNYSFSIYNHTSFVKFQLRAADEDSYNSWVNYLQRYICFSMCMCVYYMRCSMCIFIWVVCMSVRCDLCASINTAYMTVYSENPTSQFIFILCLYLYIHIST